MSPTSLQLITVFKEFQHWKCRFVWRLLLHEDRRKLSRILLLLFTTHIYYVFDVFYFHHEKGCSTLENVIWINPDILNFCISLWFVHLPYFPDHTRFIFRARYIFRAGEQGADKWLNYLGFNRVFNPPLNCSISSEI